MSSAFDRIGISLSGGDFHAAAFHRGTLSKVHAIGILNRVHVISTISGGSLKQLQSSG